MRETKPLSVSSHAHTKLFHFTGNRYFYYRQILLIVWHTKCTKKQQKNIHNLSEIDFLMDTYYCYSILFSRSAPKHFVIYQNHVPVRRTEKFNSSIIWTIKGIFERFNTPTENIPCNHGEVTIIPNQFIETTKLQSKSNYKVIYRFLDWRTKLFEFNEFEKFHT